MELKTVANRPFWLPGISFYFLSLAVALTLFFLIWAILLESGEPSPFIPAGIIAGFVLITAFIIREVLLRRVRMKRLLDQRRLDMSLDSVPVSAVGRRQKLTIGQNEALLSNIFEKSEAARILDKLPDAHWEAFGVCDEYLRLTREEMTRTHVNSPRFGPINRGRGKVKKLHRFHLLNWAELESNALALDSKNPNAGFVSKMENAETAVLSLEKALTFYPREKKLGESLEAVMEYIETMKISHKIELAERAVNKGHTNRAIRLYKDALHDLGRGDMRSREKGIIAGQLRTEIRNIERINEK